MDIRSIPISSITRKNVIRAADPVFVAKVKESMQRDGLLYPVLVVGDGPYALIDGLHRMDAAMALGWTEIHAHVLKSMDLNYLMTIGNQLRRQLKPSEMVRLILPFYHAEKVDAEKRRRAGKKIADGEAKGRAAEIAATVFGWKGKELTARIRIVEKGDEDPERFGRFVRQMDKRGRWVHQNECVLATEREIAMEPERLAADKQGLGTIYHGDMLEVLPRLEFRVDAVISDPPYGTGKIYDTDDGEQQEPSTPDAYWRWFQSRFDAMVSVLRPGGLLIFFQAYEYMVSGHLAQWYGEHDLFHVCKQVDMKKSQYIVHAVDVAVIQWKPGAARMFPPILKGVNRLNWMVSSQKPSAMARNHFACKSQDVMERLVSFTSPGAIVLDPFCGTGSTLWAAEKMKRRWVGVDSCGRYVDLAWKVRQELKDEGYFDSPGKSAE